MTKPSKPIDEKELEERLDKTQSRNLTEYYDLSALLTILKPEERDQWDDMLTYMSRRIAWYAQEFDRIPTVGFWHKTYFYMKEIS